MWGFELQGLALPQRVLQLPFPCQRVLARQRLPPKQLVFVALLFVCLCLHLRQLFLNRLLPFRFLPLPCWLRLKCSLNLVLVLLFLKYRFLALRCQQTLLPLALYALLLLVSLLVCRFVFVRLCYILLVLVRQLILQVVQFLLRSEEHTSELQSQD